MGSPDRTCWMTSSATLTQLVDKSDTWLDEQGSTFARTTGGLTGREGSTEAGPIRLPYKGQRWPGLEGPDENQKAAGKFWLEHNLEDVFVMTHLTDRLIDKSQSTTTFARKANKHRAEASRTFDFGVSEAEAGQKHSQPEFGRRMKCKCSIATSSFSCESDKDVCCKCLRYDPLVFLPNSLFSRKETQVELESAARRLVHESIEADDGLWENVDKTIRDNFVVQVEPYTPPNFKSTPGRVAFYRIRQRARAEYVEQAMHRGEDGPIATMDSAEFDLNMLLLPQLVKWCDEFCATKKALVKEATRAIEEQQRNLPEYLKQLGPSRREERNTQALLSELKWRGLSPADVGISVRQDGLIKKEVERVRTVHGVPLPHAARPRLVCRCGHAEVWHEAPVSQHGKMAASRSAPGLPPVPGRPKEGVGIRGPRDPLLPPPRAKAEITLSGGHLRLHDAGATLVGVPSAGGLRWPHHKREAKDYGHGM